MNVPFDRRLFIAWVLLVGITVSYLLIDHAASNGGTLNASSSVTIAAISFACLKVRIIMREFMEVRNAPAFLCRLTDLWVVLIAVALLGTYLGGKVIA